MTLANKKNIRSSIGPVLKKSIQKAVMTIKDKKNRFLKETSPMNRLATIRKNKLSRFIKMWKNSIAVR